MVQRCLIAQCPWWFSTFNFDSFERLCFSIPAGSFSINSKWKLLVREEQATRRSVRSRPSSSCIGHWSCVHVVFRGELSFTDWYEKVVIFIGYKSPKGTNVCAKKGIGVKWGRQGVWRCVNGCLTKKFGAFYGGNRGILKQTWKPDENRFIGLFWDHFWIPMLSGWFKAMKCLIRYFRVLMS